MGFWVFVTFVLGLILLASARRSQWEQNRFMAKAGVICLCLATILFVVMVIEEDQPPLEVAAQIVEEQYPDSEYELVGVVCHSAARYSCTSWDAQVVVEGDAVGTITFDHNGGRIDKN